MVKDELENDGMDGFVPSGEVQGFMAKIMGRYWSILARKGQIGSHLKNVLECKVRKRWGMRTPRRWKKYRFNKYLLSIYCMSGVRSLISWHFQFRNGQEEISSRTNHQAKLSKNGHLSIFILHALWAFHTLGHFCLLEAFSLFFWGPHSHFSPPISLDTTTVYF